MVLQVKSTFRRRRATADQTATTPKDYLNLFRGTEKSVSVMLFHISWVQKAVITPMKPCDCSC